MPGDPLVVRDDADHVATLTLARPEQRNALSDALLRELYDHLTEVDEDPTVHVVVLAGQGPAFSAGHDLRELQANPDPTFREDLFARCAAVMLGIVGMRQPVIAKVHGMATAAGCQLVASCDLAVAGASARFATPGVDIGLFCSTPMVALTRNVGPKQAMEMLLTGTPIDAAEAVRMGLVNRAVADEELNDAVADLAARIAAKSPAVVAIGKEAFRRQRELQLHDAYTYASAVMIANLDEPDAAEGIAAFLEKRPPEWGAG